MRDHVHSCSAWAENIANMASLYKHTGKLWGGYIFNSRVNQQSRLISSFDLFYVPIKIAPKCSPGIRLSTVFPYNLTTPRDPAALKMSPRFCQLAIAPPSKSRCTVKGQQLYVHENTHYTVTVEAKIKFTLRNHST